MLPEHLEYLRGAGEKFGNYPFHPIPVDDIPKLSDEEIHELLRVVQEVDQKGHGPGILGWLENVIWYGPHDRDYHITRHLMFRIREFAKEGRVGFKVSDLWVRDAPAAYMAWADLPVTLRYLIEPATRYGIIQFEDEVEEFKKVVTREQMREFRALAVKMDRDDPEIQHWLDISKRGPEWARVFFFEKLIYELGLR